VAKTETGPGSPVELADLRSKVVSNLGADGSLTDNIRQPRQMRTGQEDGARPMRIERRNTTSGQSPYTGIDFRLTTSEIRNPDGSVVFRLENVEVPQFWSQVASDVLAQKYFRKAGVAARLLHPGRG
jgi:class II vitamin B12-dependent ribonucleotide reductase